MKLRDYQEAIKTKVYEAWESGHKNVLLCLPTGGGKTKCFSSIAIDKAILPFVEKLPTAILVHRKELVLQICMTLAEENIPHNIIAPRNVIKGIIAAERQAFQKQFYNYHAPVTVISVDTLNARSKQHEKWANTIKLWITDEAAHVLKDNKWGKAIALFENAIGLGVTATPSRLDKRGLGRHADGVFDVMVQGPPTKWLIDQGYLSRYKIAVPRSDYRHFLKDSGAGADFTKQAMAEASIKSHIVGDIVENYIKFANGKQAIVFSSDIAAGVRTEQAFQDKGIKAKLLTGDTPDQERLQGLIDFRNKQTQVLLNVDLFDEGLDVPGIEAVIMGRPTMSLSKYLQMIGRGLRVLEGKEYCIVIDHVGNVNEHGLPCEIREWTLDRLVKKRDKVNLMRICGNPGCNAPYDRLLNECPYCKWKPEIKKSEGSGRVPLKEVDGDLELLDPEQIREMEQAAILEAPALVAQRVSKAAGGKAGIKAMRDQVDRIAAQKDLVHSIARWAGIQREIFGLSNREINKKFYIYQQMTITQALAEPKAEMLIVMENIEGEIRRYDQPKSTRSTG